MIINVAIILISLCLIGEPEAEPHRADNCIECQHEATGEITELGQSMGTFTITAYCGCSECCGAYAEGRGDVVYGAIGEPLTANYSIAVDPNVIGFGETVMINGQQYKAQDTGGLIKGNRIDIYMDDHEEAIKWGVQYIEVYKEVR